MKSVNDVKIFSKKDSMMVKGIAIILMYVHHLFYSYDTFSGLNIIFKPLTADQTIEIAQACKICVGIFVFLSAFGITRQSANKQIKTNITVIKRYITLWFGFAFIFILALLFGFLGRYPIEVYGNGKIGFINGLIDFLGLAYLFHSPTFNPTWWYMPLAYAIIALTPILIRFHKKTGVIFLSVIILIPRLLSLEHVVAIQYLLALGLGIIFAQNNIFEKLKTWTITKNRYVSKSIKLLVTVLLFYISVFILVRIGYPDMMYGLLAIIVCYGCFEFLSNLSVICSVLSYLGKHSMNMFLSHTLFYMYYFRDFIYSPQYSFLIVLLLIAITLLFSICIEYLKRILKYNKLIDAAILKCTNKWQKIIRTTTQISPE